MDKHLRIRLSSSELSRWKSACSYRGLNMSKFIREVINREVSGLFSDDKDFINYWKHSLLYTFCSKHKGTDCTEEALDLSIKLGCRVDLDTREFYYESEGKRVILCSW